MNLSAQTSSATINGQITDSQGKIVPGVEVQAVNIDTNVAYPGKTNDSGIYVIPGVPPGRYRLLVLRDGFKEINKTGLVLHVQDTLEQNFALEVGSISESVTVTSGGININTTDASVSTVVDRQFAENLPMNGRSFQSLIDLTPGVVLTTSNNFDNGQFSVNGQRGSSNYWMVDGVSANIGIGGVEPGNGFGGALGSFSAQGGTNSLVSVDALQEFRVQTSTFAPEFGRTPGGQISIVTRSGTNQFHGTAFDYLRNDAFDAADWFNGYTNTPPLPKAEERQNDFGGVLGGPLIKDRTFFFFSYEGLRLRLPQTTLSNVPDILARQSASPAVQPYLNSFPQPNGADDTSTGIAQFNASYSNPSTLDAYSLRIDHRLSDKLAIFGRYNYSPSNVVQRGLSGTTLNTVSPNKIRMQTTTVGTTWAISSVAANDLRFNYSRVNSDSYLRQDSFGGAVPLASLPLPNALTSQNANFFFRILSLGNYYAVGAGAYGHNLQRQINIVDNLSVQQGSHSVKFGIDFRRLSPEFNAPEYSQAVASLDVPSAEAGNLFYAFLSSTRSAALLFHNLGIFAQDTWRVTPRLTLTYGLRWDVDFTPSSANGPGLPAVSGFNLGNLSQLALAPPGTPPYKTAYGSVAPRFGLAYRISQNQSWGSVLRGGFGTFYDLATSEVGNALYNYTYPFGAQSFVCCFNIQFPLDAVTSAPPPITTAGLKSGGLWAFDPNLKLPYTLQWNVALEQALGGQQTTMTFSYVGSAGRRLIQTTQVTAPNPNFGYVSLITNAGTSDYDALQLQLRRQLSHGIQALASYTWSHSLDSGSAGSLFGNVANALVPSSIAQSNRGPSDFDIRNALSAALTYDITVRRTNPLVRAILSGWSLQNVIQARSAPPVDINSYVYNGIYVFSLNGYFLYPRPDRVPGQPLYIYGSQYPGGKAINPAAFTSPPIDANGNLLRQGNVGRNAVRGFGAAQWDFAVHRDFPIHESVKLQFRAEMFNILNHPNFGQPDGLLADPTFGRSTQMLGRSLAQVAGSGALSPLYQIGGPRSVQFALKLRF